MIDPPKPLSGTAQLVAWLNQLLRFCISNRIVESPTVRPEQTAKGVTLHVKPGIGGGTTSSGMNYRGTFDGNATYQKGDVVRVMTGNFQGVWICMVEGGIRGDVSPPVWPEPSALTPPQVNKWELLAFGVQVTKVCSDGSKSIYVNSTPPI